MIPKWLPALTFSNKCAAPGYLGPPPLLSALWAFILLQAFVISKITFVVRNLSMLSCACYIDNLFHFSSRLWWQLPGRASPNKIMFSVLTFVSSPSFVSGNIATCHFNIFQWHFFPHSGPLKIFSSELRPLLIVLRAAACGPERGLGKPACANQGLWAISSPPHKESQHSIRGPQFGGNNSLKAWWLL